MQHSDLLDEVVSHCDSTGIPYVLVDVRDTPRQQQLSIPIYPVVGIGDLSFTGNDRSCVILLRDGLVKAILAWLPNHSLILLTQISPTRSRILLRTKHQWL